ncbi:hypothetical protein D1872_207800 [compost metagenome]
MLRPLRNEQLHTLIIHTFLNRSHTLLCNLQIACYLRNIRDYLIISCLILFIVMIIIKSNDSLIFHNVSILQTANVPDGIPHPESGQDQRRTSCYTAYRHKHPLFITE